MKKYFFIFLFAITLSYNSFGGVWVGTLICVNNSGDTVLTASFEDMINLKNAKLEMEKSMFDFSNNDIDFVIFDPSAKVFSFSVESLIDNTHSILMFWAIPDTFQKMLSEEFHEVYKFKGKLKRPDNIEIEVNCSLDYSL